MPAAGLALTAAGPLSATIIYQATPISATEGSLTFSVDGNPGNGLDEFSLVLSSSYVGYNSLVKPSSLSLNAQDSSVLLVPNLQFGDSIDASTTFTTSGWSISDGQQYLGFSFLGGDTYYGWISVTHNQSSSVGSGSGTIDGWAYNDTGAGITVGQTSAVPEPAATSGILALLAGSSAVWRRRRRQVSPAVEA